MTETAFAAAAVTLFAFLMALAALSDLTTLRIPNKLVIALGAGFIAFAPFAGWSSSELIAAAAVALVVLLGGVVLFARGWIGGGDAKLAGVAALWMGPEHVSIYLLYSALCGGALTLALLQARSLPLPARLCGAAWIKRLHSPSTGVPYGVALAFAALIVLPQTRWSMAFL